MTRSNLTTRDKESTCSALDKKKSNEFSEDRSYSPIKNLLSFQRSVGNRATERLLRSGIAKQKNKINDPTVMRISNSEISDNVLQPEPDITKKTTGTPELNRQHTGGNVPSGVTRNTFPGCSDDQNFYVDLSRVRAPRWVNSAISGLQNMLTNQGNTVTTTEGALNQFFHPPAGRGGNMATIGGGHQPETIRTIISRLTRMRDALENPRLFRCVNRTTCARENSSHRHDVLAYAGHGTAISICPEFFNDRGVTDQIRVLIHESAHQVGLMRNVHGRQQLMNLSLNQAMTNAESYALFVVDNFIGPPVNRPFREQVSPVSQNWGHSHWYVELEITNPIHERAYFGRGESRYIENEHPIIETPFPQNRPIHLVGRIRYYLDSPEVQKPPFEPTPYLQAQILFNNYQTQVIHAVVQEEDPLPAYLGPGRALRSSFSGNIDATFTENGELSIALLMGTAPLNISNTQIELLFNDTIELMPNNEI